MYYWDVIETLRKLAMTGLLVFVSPASVTQMVVAAALALGSAHLCHQFAPFVDPEDNADYYRASASTVVVVFSCLLLRVGWGDAFLGGVMVLTELGTSAGVLLLPLLGTLLAATLAWLRPAPESGEGVEGAEGSVEDGAKEQELEDDVEDAAAGDVELQEAAERHLPALDGWAPAATRSLVPGPPGDSPDFFCCVGRPHDD